MKQGISDGISVARGRSGRGGRLSGQALVEMAFVVMVLMLLSLGIVQFGIVYSTAIQLTNLTREGARFGAIHGTDNNVEAQIEDYIQANCKGTTIRATDLSDSNISVTANNKTAGQPITVTVVYNMTNKFFLPKMPIGFMADTNQRWSKFTQTATMTIE